MIKNKFRPYLLFSPVNFKIIISLIYEDCMNKILGFIQFDMRNYITYNGLKQINSYYTSSGAILSSLGSLMSTAKLKKVNSS